MAKTNKPSTKLKYLSNLPTWHERYKSLLSWRDNKPTPAYLEDLSVELMEWSDQDDALSIREFCKTRGLKYDTIHTWSKKYPNFKEAYRYALDSLAIRREHGLIFKGWPASTLHFTQGHYDQVWRGEQTFKAILIVKVQELLAKNKEELAGLSTEDLSNCVVKLIEQAWGDSESKS